MHLMYELYKTKWKKLCNITTAIKGVKVIDKKDNSLCKK